MGGVTSFYLDTVASLSFHVEVPYGCALTERMNVACKIATDEKAMALHPGGHCECRFFLY